MRNAKPSKSHSGQPAPATGAAVAARRRRQKQSPGASDVAAVGAHAEAAVRLLKSLAHGHRLRVLCLLVEGELSVGQINERVELSQSALSQQLARLRANGLVATRREAQTIYYRIAAERVRGLISALHDIYCG